MGLAGDDNKRNLEAIALLALFLSFSSFSFVNLTNKPVACFPGDIGTSKCPLSAGTHDLTPLGTWLNMPRFSVCGSGNTTVASCELMGNSSYRSVLRFESSGQFQGVTAFLQVGCISPSSNSTAALQLQVATYSAPTNSTVFANIGGPVGIASGNCPGNPVGTSGAVPAVSANPTSLIFRVVGVNGNGAGDTPRFSSLQVNLQQQTIIIAQVVVASRSATAFTAFVYLNYPKPSTTVENFDWMATNSSNTLGCNLVTDPCLQHGAATCTVAVGAFSCSIATTFTTAFAGTPNVVCSSRNAGGQIVIAIGSLNLFTAETLTV